MLDDAVTKLQESFCLIDLQGEIRTLDKRQIKEVLEGNNEHDLNYYQNQPANLLMERLLEASNLALEDKEIRQAIKEFKRSPETLFYTSVAFDPRPQPPRVLNLWRGHTVTPKEGNCEVIEDLIYDIICDRSDEKYDYLLKYLAHTIQKPEEKPGVMPVFIGGQGVGKGSFCRLLEAIFSRTTLFAQNITEVLGKFTGSLERNYIVWLDEALFTHDKRSSDQLKSVLTEPTMRIEQKFQPKRTIQSHHRYLAATNNQHFATINRDDRRFFICNVSERRKRDTEYFDRYYKTLNDGVSVPGFVHKLLGINLSDFNVRERPLTKEHAEQKLQSLEGFDRYYYELLQRAVFTGEFNQSRTWNGSMNMPTQEVKKAYLGFDKNAERHRAVTERHIVSSIRRMCPSAKKDRWTEGVYQVRGVRLPSIETARAEFSKYIDYPLDWDEET